MFVSLVLLVADVEAEQFDGHHHKTIDIRLFVILAAILDFGCHILPRSSPFRVTGVVVDDGHAKVAQLDEVAALAIADQYVGRFQVSVYDRRVERVKVMYTSQHFLPHVPAHKELGHTDLMPDLSGERLWFMCQHILEIVIAQLHQNKYEFFLFPGTYKFDHPFASESAQY